MGVLAGALSLCAVYAPRAWSVHAKVMFVFLGCVHTLPFIPPQFTAARHFLVTPSASDDSPRGAPCL